MTTSETTPPDDRYRLPGAIDRYHQAKRRVERANLELADVTEELRSLVTPGTRLVVRVQFQCYLVQSVDEDSFSLDPIDLI